MLRSQTWKEYRLISVNDEAIDREKAFAARDIYKVDRDPDVFQPDHFLPGAEPSWFVIKPLSAQVRLWCEQRDGDVMQWWWAFRFGVQSVGPLDGESWEADLTDSGIKGEQVLSDACMTKLVALLGAGIVDEIGQAILTRSRLGKGQRGGYSLPRTVRYGQ